mgnify:FL=1
MKGLRLILLLAMVFLASASARAGKAKGTADRAGVTGGLVVFLGWEESGSLAALSAGDGFVVQGLHTDAARVSRAKRILADRGLAGPVTARVFDGRSLPYAERMVNLLVVNEPFQVAREEMKRVLVPGGVLLEGGGRWTKPWPQEIDDWSHYNHDAGHTGVTGDTRVGPPRRIKWSAPPLMTRHHFATSFITAISAGGRVFTVLDEKAKQVERHRPQEWCLIARDAFNGAPLWKFPLPDFGWPQTTDTGYGHRGGSGFALTRPQTVLTDGRHVYLFTGSPWTFTVLDAATGEVVREFEDVQGVGEMVHEGGMVFVAVRPPEGDETVGGRNRMRTVLGEGELTAIRAGSWEVLWKVPAPGFRFETLTARGGRVFYESDRNMVALEAETGEELWRTDFGDKTPRVFRGWNMWNPVATEDLLIVNRGYLGAAGSKGGLVALDAATGEQIWLVDGMRPGKSHIFPIGDTIYCGVRRFSLGDGSETGRVSTEGLWSKGHHSRCYPWRATPDYLISTYRGCEFLSINANRPAAKNDYVRSNCAVGVFPANGLLYKPPHGCFCYNGVMLNGFLALAPEGPTTESDVPPSAPSRLHKGPAYGRDLSSPAGDADWPMYRGGPRRLGSNPRGVDARVSVLWEAAPGGSLTPPVCADGLLVAAQKDAHRVLAFDASDGASLWQFTADARIDCSPTVHRGRVLFGCADGFVYCLDAEDGALAWRFRAAPRERWIMADGQLESAWPVHGTVLVEDGLAYVTAGRHTWFDGGIHVYALDPATGEVLHYCRLKDEALPEGQEIDDPPYTESSHVEGADSDILVSDGENLYLGPLMLSKELERTPAPYISDDPKGVDPVRLTGAPYVDQANFDKIPEEKAVKWARKLGKAMGSKKTGLHLSSTAGFLDPIPYERHYWMYAKLWPGNNHANPYGAKSGQILCIDEQNTYGVKMFNRRQKYGAGDASVSDRGELLFADDNNNEPIIPDPARGCRAGIGYTRAAPPKWFHWKKMYICAMTVAGDHLFVAGANLGKGPDPFAPYEGRAGSTVMAFEKETGEPLAALELDDQPVFDGLIAAAGRLYVTMHNGDILCLGRQP